MSAEPSPVTIVRPKNDRAAIIGRLIGALLGLATSAWMVSVAADVALDHPLSLWHALLVVLAARSLQREESGRDTWSWSWTVWAKRVQS